MSDLPLQNAIERAASAEQKLLAIKDIYESSRSELTLYESVALVNAMGRIASRA